MNLQSHYYKTVSKQYICGWQQNRGWTGKQDICGWPPSGLMLGTFMMMLATTMMMTTIRQANEHDDDVRPKNVALASFLNAWRASCDPHLPTISSSSWEISSPWEISRQSQIPPPYPPTYPVNFKLVDWHHLILAVFFLEAQWFHGYLFMVRISMNPQF